jgi:hypothetical protein
MIDTIAGLRQLFYALAEVWSTKWISNTVHTQVKLSGINPIWNRYKSYYRIPMQILYRKFVSGKKCLHFLRRKTI